MKQLLVLGIGNRMMEDDGIGVHIVEALALENDQDSVDFIAGETDVDYCLNKLSFADKCIIIDGAILRGEPCSIGVFSLQDVYKQKRSALSFHDFDLIHAMKTENLLKEGLLITIEVYSLGFSLELSEVMRFRFPEIVSSVGDVVRQYMRSINKIDP